jgi:nicotinamide-nucleotide amidase
MQDLADRGIPGMIDADLLSVGSEILRGETIDTNAAYLGGQLNELGFHVLGVRALPDDRTIIARAVREARARAQLVLVTGGLGPTHDDLTRQGVADALGEPMHEDEGLLATLRERFGGGAEMPISNRHQALLIPSAVPLPNPIGSAPGWWIDRDDGALATMPGVPSEMRRMFAEQIAPRIEARFAVHPPASRIIKTFGIGESTLAERLAEILEGATPYEAGIYARDDGVHVHFASRDHPEAVEVAAARALELTGIDAFGTDDDDLAGVVLRALAAHGIASLSSIEWGTGGALLAILSMAATSDGAQYVGGVLANGVSDVQAPPAEAVLSCRLLPQDPHGRSGVEIEMRGFPGARTVETRVHGSGPQRLRRAAFATLDATRRALIDG